MRRDFLQKYSAYLDSALAVILLTTFLSTISLAKPTSSEQAKLVVQNWIAMESQPLESVIGAKTEFQRSSMGVKSPAESRAETAQLDRDIFLPFGLIYE